MSEIDPATIKAYLETDYCVSAPEPFTLRVGVVSSPLTRQYREHQIGCSTFVTACNPRSRIVEDRENARRHAELANELAHLGLTFFAGVAQHPKDGWPAEPGFLVLGLPLDEAKRLGEKYDQNAIVWCGPDATPELVLLR